MTLLRPFSLALTLLCLTPVGLGGCATMGLRSAVSMKVAVKKGTPKSALVYVDGTYIGTLSAVSQQGVRIPEGKHRVSVEKNGYYPYDTLVVSDRKPIHLEVELIRLPD